MAQDGITVTKLKKAYKKVAVLKDVSFEVKKGSIFALLGKNGAGKTTTINILTTLIKSDGGSAVIDGIDVNRDPHKIRERIGLTGQFAAIDDMLTGRENLALIADLRHVKNSQETAEALLERFSLTEAADRRTSTYSGGMRRRLDIAMSLIGTPSVIFLDEPTTGLDPEARNDMWQTIKDLAKNGTTVFLTTQYLEEADQLADIIAILHKGEIVASGTASELKRLLPKGFIELQFESKRHRDKAAQLLGKYELSLIDTVSLRIISEGNAQQLATVFTELRDAGIEVSNFSQTQPTLDDVFFKITKDEEKK